MKTLDLLCRQLSRVFCKEGRRKIREYTAWADRDYHLPMPPYIKRAFIASFADQQTTFVETGTYFGDTARYMAPKVRQVITIEPQERLYERAKASLQKFGNVRVVHASSEEALAPLLVDLTGPTLFWLDGHYSGPETHLGKQESPLQSELVTIADHIKDFHDATILIDDVRCLMRPDEGYPPFQWVKTWGEKYGLMAEITNDILVIQKLS
jgi:hypothetical protein